MAETGEICISGITTPRKHFPTQPKGREEKRAWLYKKINFK
jgi:hypothetical protein